MHVGHSVLTWMFRWHQQQLLSLAETSLQQCCTVSMVPLQRTWTDLQQMPVLHNIKQASGTICLSQGLATRCGVSVFFDRPILTCLPPVASAQATTCIEHAYQHHVKAPKWQLKKTLDLIFLTRTYTSCRYRWPISPVMPAPVCAQPLLP